MINDVHQQELDKNTAIFKKIPLERLAEVAAKLWGTTVRLGLSSRDPMVVILTTICLEEVNELARAYNNDDQLVIAARGKVCE